MPEPPELPAAVERTVGQFWALSARRQRGEGGLQPLGYAEIEAYSRLTGDPITGWDIGIIIDMDDAYLSQMAEERAEESERRRSKNG